MNHRLSHSSPGKAVVCAALLFSPLSFQSVWAQKASHEKGDVNQQIAPISSARMLNPTTIEIRFADESRRLLDFYADDIFRVFQDPEGGMIRDPESTPQAQILTNHPRRPVSSLQLADQDGVISVQTGRIRLQLDKPTTLMKVTDLATKTVVCEEAQAVRFGKKAVLVALKQSAGEYFYGGGVQNGRFSHKGKSIAIENQNSWTDGGVASPTPFYWSTNGYGLMFHTFNQGTYDFGLDQKDLARLQHETRYLDVFYMIDAKPADLLADFYQLTGNPVLIPKFGFYQGHLNAYNRDFWKEDEKGVLFEDGKNYKESQNDSEGIKESLNGEKDNYQFSARAVIDRYREHDMPFGWLLPNDGYGAGYGQEDSLDGNIANLRSLGNYARENGVQIGLWTQSDLHPKPEVSALLQRDIVKEVGEAGVRVLKTDVAWVGAGYSFGLNGIADVAHIMSYYGDDSRPFIISLDGWAGTQRYATIWTGDQTGGVWEYIRFHIPTYLGSGLSGQPNITSDVDGIFGGNNPVINTRDIQWKTFTPMELNMDGWGANPKYPHTLGEPTTSLNRGYLKLKARLLPYTYSIAKEATTGLPMIRAMFLEFPIPYTLGKATEYQFLFGPNFLVAPIYQDTRSDEAGNDIRNGIYLPAGTWIDYITGDRHEGKRILNNFEAPIWKLPVFVKSGAIIPMANSNNNVSQINKSLRSYEVYPDGNSSFTEYDDDGTTEAYKRGKGTTTLIESSAADGKARITIHPTVGSFNGFVRNKETELSINVTARPATVTAHVGDTEIQLEEAASMEAYLAGENAFFYDAAPNLNQFATPGSGLEDKVIVKNPQLRVKLAATDVTESTTSVTVEGFKFEPADKTRTKTGSLAESIAVRVNEEDADSKSLKPTWDAVANANYYEIEFQDMIYSTIRDTELIFERLDPETRYAFKIRSVNKRGHSGWTDFQATTKANPYEFAIRGIVAENSAEDQGGSGVANLFDMDQASIWHTQWGTNSVPFELILNLKSINQLDKLEYLPRTEGVNGNLLAGTVSYSADKENWAEAGKFTWENNSETKQFDFASHPTARFIKLSVTDGKGGFGSGREIYVFKVPNSPSYIPGDINNDQLTDRNDLTSYINYTGLRKGDADFEGYISNGDINRNDLIDAYDVSVVATQLDGGIGEETGEKVGGNITVKAAKAHYVKDETIEVIVKGNDLKSVNALSFAMPYDSADYEFLGTEPINMKQMENLTNDRLHTNGARSLYPTFVNVGDTAALDGTAELFKLKLKAKRDLDFNLMPQDGFLVDKKLNFIKF